MNHAQAINEAREAYFVARAAREVFMEEILAAHPGEDDASVDAFDDAYDAGGGHAFATAMSEATDALLRAGRAWCADASPDGEWALAYQAALGEGRAISFKARDRIVDRLCRLDTRTIR